MLSHVHLGFAVSTGASVDVPIGHLAVTGQTQASGKTTTLEGLVARSNRAAIAFVTKRHEGSFRGDHHRLPAYFRERADWQFVSAVLEATLRERMKFERSWIMRACKGATTLAQVHRNVRRLMEKTKGLSADVYMTLDHYLDIVVPQIERLPHGTGLTLRPGLNVMDLADYSTELQALVIRSVMEWVYSSADGVLVIIPEAWEFIPQNRGSPVLLACEQLIRKGGAGGNFVWLDSQDIAGVHKNVLRQVGVWILGVQREANEVKRALVHIPGGRRKPSVGDIMQLERGHFFVCYGDTVIKTYVQPAWMDEHLARSIACGASRPPDPPKLLEAIVTEEEAARLRAENEELRRRVADLEGRIVKAVEDKRPPAPLLSDGEVWTPPAAVEGKYINPPERVRRLLGGQRPETIDELYDVIKQRLLADENPKVLALLRRVPELEVHKRIERVTIDGASTKGRVVQLLANGFYDDGATNSGTRYELKRTGSDVNNATLGKILGELLRDGFLTLEPGDRYRAVKGMKVNIVEAAA